MEHALSLPSAARCWDPVRLREHGSWSLALKPVVLGLLAMPSTAGAWLAVAVAAGFLGRRPLRITWRDPHADRRP